MNSTNNPEREKKAQALYDKSVKLYKEFKLDESIELLNIILDDYHDVFTECYIHKSLGQSFYHLEKYDLALSHLHKALEEADPKKDELCYLIALQFTGDSYMALHQYNKSINYYNLAEKHLHCYKEDEWTLNLMSFHLLAGRCNRKLSNYKNALDHFRTFRTILESHSTLERKDDENLVFYELGRTYYKMRDDKSALIYIEKIDSSKLPSSFGVEYYIMMADLYIVGDNSRKALAVLDRIRSHKLDNIQSARINHMTGVIHYNLGNYKESRVYLKKAIDAKNTPPWIAEISQNYLRAISKSLWGGIIPKFIHRIFGAKRQ